MHLQEVDLKAVASVAIISQPLPQTAMEQTAKAVAAVLKQAGIRDVTVYLYSAQGGVIVSNPVQPEIVIASHLPGEAQGGRQNGRRSG